MSDRYFFNFSKLDYIRRERLQGCILCLIRGGDPAVVDLTVYRDELFSVAVNLYPYNPGHLLLFPARHLVDLRQYTAAEQDRLWRLTNHFMDLIDRLHHPKGYNLGYNMGPDAGASIDHLHLHLIPRYPHELGIADLLAGKRVLVEDPRETARRLRELVAQLPFSTAMS